jgi:competence protein ComEA
MKKAIIALFAATIAVTLLITIAPPVFAGSDNPAIGQGVTEKTGTALQDEKVNINTANLKTLSSLKGIGPERAKSIIDYRSQNGRFESIEDIKKVKGIGENIFSQISSLIRVE